MMSDLTTTRTISQSLQVGRSVDDVFGCLITPSAIRQWWGATTAIVDPRVGGRWTASWGAEDDPDYITSAVMTVFDRPNRIEMRDFSYYAKQGAPGCTMDGVWTEYVIEPAPSGATLIVTQHGFPSTSDADQYYEACQQGWVNTLDGLNKFLAAVQV